MKSNFATAIRMTVVTTILLGLLFPLAVTGLSQLMFPRQANGSLIRRGGTLIGSRLIGQQFSSRGYFHSRPSGAGAGYEADNSGSPNLGPTNQQLVARVQTAVSGLAAENSHAPVPIDLVTTSASGLDPDISPEAAEFQAERVARERGLSLDELRDMIRQHNSPRQFGFLGEPRVNVLELNLALDELGPRQ